MKKVCLLWVIGALLAVPAGAEVIGYEPFDYADGGIGGRTGGIGWDFDNVAKVHTSTVSNWNVSGTANVVAARLETNSDGWARREYNGPTEGSGDNPETDERRGAIRASGVVYYAVTYTQLNTNSWSGFSGVDFGTERIFFGQVGGQGDQKYFGIDESGVGATFTNVPVEVGRTYRLIAAIDFDYDRLLLWVDPNSTDFHNRSGGTNSADAVRTYGGTNWNTAVRLGSAGHTRWDDLVVATTFEEAMMNPGTLASTPSPAHKATVLAVQSPVFAWSPGVDPNDLTQTISGIASYKLYLGTAPDAMTLIDTISAGDTMLDRVEYTLGSNLNYGTTYYWRVDMVRNSGGVSQGLVWTFETEPSEPMIASISYSQAVAEGDNAVFKVTATCPLPVTYQWYKVTAGGDIALSDGGKISGARTAELSIANVTLADEGYFYCIVTNDRQESAQSDSTMVAVRRMIAYWDFENDNIQSLVEGNPVCKVYGNPQFVQGKIGNAMHFDGDGDVVSMAYADRDYFNICNYGMSVAAWVKTDQNTEWNGYVSRDGENDRGWQIRQHNNMRACFTTRPNSASDDADGESSTMLINDGKWRLIVGVFDLAAGKKKLYIDGVLNTEDNVYAPIAYTRGNVALGGRQGDDGGHGGFANVTLDDVRIFNYPLSSREVAALYTQVETDVMICVDNAPPTMDLNGDCIVDLADLVLFVGGWLEDNRVF
ncbi:MAG TPA: immunoglobulin domain-containing protein [Anaerohalosphaeraceae bacterium]|nr:immunoglobulin domain-containing protein [Anaerohalosphaeraceae bacterium]HRT50081.1 immunoglobulin domain-containing protein [Anaerohalosphaeraceae bacterium]HRT86015.1 immunoglobulin domain-containing protein [Anaerohalosphaeraceae bacterium]